ncbi:MAG: ROK family protein [Acidobacteriota bacterium]
MIGAIDIGGSKIAGALVDDDGRVVSKDEGPAAPFRDSGSEGINRIGSLLRDCIRRAGSSITGIGVSCTGPVDPVTGVIGNVDFLPGWRGLNLVDQLSREFLVPVAVENDADACALAESAWGSGQGKTRFLYVTVSTGIGVGLVLDGKLYRGVDGSHPEMGHHVIESSGPLCTCGARGCWEALAAGPAMVAWVKQQAPADSAPLEDLTAARICELARQRDELAVQAVKREGYYLGVGLANLVTLFTPELIALGGGVMRSWSLFEDHCREVIRRNCVLVPFEKTGLTLASLGPDIGILGAAQVWRHRFF